MNWWDSRFYQLFFQVLLNSTAGAVFLLVLLRIWRNKSPSLGLMVCWAALIVPLASIFSIYWFRIQPFEVPAIPQSEKARLLSQCIVSFWIVGSMCVVARCIHGYMQVSAIVRRAGVPTDPGVAGIAARLQREHKVDFRASYEVQSPAVCGIWNPVILFPQSLQLSPGEWRAILLHEVAHVHRRDSLWNALQCFLEALFFFSPGVWWISSKIRAERECAADHHVVEHTGERLNLLEALGSLVERRAAVGAVQYVGSTAGNNLIQRLRRLSMPVQCDTRRGPAVVVLLLLLLFQCAIPSLRELPESRVVVITRTLIR